MKVVTELGGVISEEVSGAGVEAPCSDGPFTNGCRARNPLGRAFRTWRPTNPRFRSPSRSTTRVWMCTRCVAARARVYSYSSVDRLL